MIIENFTTILLVLFIVILLVRIFMLTSKIKKFKQLEKEYHFLKEAFDALPTPAYYKNKVGKILYCNKKFYQDFGHTNKKTLHELEDYHGTNSSQMPLIFDNDIKKEVLLSQNNFLDSQKDLLGSIGLVFDIDKDAKEKKAIVEKKNQLHYALENAEEGYWEWDIDTDKAYYSSKWKQIMGYTKEDEEPNSLSGWLNIVSSLDMAKVNEQIRKYLDGDIKFLDIEHRIKTFSSTRWVNIRAKALKNFENKPIKLLGTIKDITALKEKQQELENKKNLFVSFIDTIPLLAYIKDKSGKYLYLNNFYHKYIGYQEWKDKNAHDFHPQEIAQEMEQSDREAFYEAISEHQEIIPDAAGHKKIFQTYKAPIKNANQELLLGVGIDISQKINFKENLSLYKKILDATKSSIVVLDATRKITYVNKIFEKVTGFFDVDAIGKLIDIRYSAQHQNSFYDKIWREAAQNGVWRGKLYFKDKDSTDSLEIANIYALHNSQGKVKNYFIISQGIQREKFVEKSFASSLDPITNLPNKSAFIQLLEQSVLKAERGQKLFALIYINLDDFKLINNSFGEEASNAALHEIAKKLSYHIRQNDVLAKLENDEFIIILDNITSNSDINIVCQRILKELSQPASFNGHKEILSASIGVSIYPNHANEPKKLFDFAHLAMYKSKREGKNMFTIYKP